MRTAVLAALAALVVPLPGCVPRLPAEPPRRVLARERRLPVWLTSEPPGRRVFAAGAAGRPGAELGRTPLRLGELVVEKELWKHGEGRPPAPAGGGAGAVSRDGGAIEPDADAPATTWSVFVEAAGGALERHDLVLAAEELPRAYREGRVELALPPAAAETEAEAGPRGAAGAP